MTYAKTKFLQKREYQLLSLGRAIESVTQPVDDIVFSTGRKPNGPSGDLTSQGPRLWGETKLACQRRIVEGIMS